MRLFHAATALAATSALALTLTACGNSSGNDASGDHSTRTGFLALPATATDGAPAETPVPRRMLRQQPGQRHAMRAPARAAVPAAAGGGAQPRAVPAPGQGLGFSFSYRRRAAGRRSWTTSSSWPWRAEEQDVRRMHHPGLPRVDLKSSGGSWSLTRSGATPEAGLAAGGSTTFTITFLP